MRVSLPSKTFYASFGHRVKSIHCDHDSTIVSLTTELLSHAIIVAALGAGKHERICESMTSKVRIACRPTVASLLYVLPDFLYPKAFEFVCMTMNLIPNNHTSWSSPRSILTGDRECGRYFDFQFGQTVVCRSNTNSFPDKMRPKGMYGILVSRSYLSSTVTIWVPETKSFV